MYCRNYINYILFMKNINCSTRVFSIHKEMTFNEDNARISQLTQNHSNVPSLVKNFEIFRRHLLANFNINP